MDDMEKARSSGAKRYSQWKVLRWVVAAIVGAGVWGGGWYWSHELERTAPQREAVARAEQQKARTAFEKQYPKCTRVTTSEVTNSDGTVTKQESRDQVYCDGRVPPQLQSEPMPHGLKVALITAGVLVGVLVLVLGIANPEVLLSLVGLLVLF